MSNRKSSVVKGFFSSFGTSFILQLVSLLIIPIYLNLTSQELYGLWLTLGAILGWIKIGDMGLGLSLTRNSINALENNNYDLLKSYIWGTVFTTFIIGICVCLLGGLFANHLVDLFSINDEFKNDFKNTYLLLLLVALIRPGCISLSSIINAKQHIAFLHIKNTLVTLTSIIVNIIFLKLGYGILSFAIGLLFETILTLIVDIIYLNRVDKKIFLYPPNTTKKDIASLLKFGAPYQALKIANLVSTSTDNIIIAAILGATSVTIYVFTGKLAFLLAVFLVSVIPSVLFPGFSQLFEQKNDKKIKNLYFKLTDLAIRLGLFSGICYFYINETFINLWVGPENYGGDDLTRLFIIWIIFESFTRGLTSIIYASADLSGLTFISFCEALLNISLTLIFIQSMGLFGVVLGTVLSRLIAVIYIPFKINNVLNIDNTFYFLKIMKIGFGYAIPMIIMCILLDNLFNDSIDPFLKIMIFCSSILFVNILFKEGYFFFKQKGLTLKQRFQLLIDDFYSV